MHLRPTPRIDDIEDAAHEFCRIDISDIRSREKHKYTRDWQVQNRCFEGLYLATILEHGFGIDGTKQMVTLALEVEGVEVEWTLGFALAELHLLPTDTK